MEAQLLFEEVQGGAKKSIIDFLKGISGVFLLAVIVNIIILKGHFNDLTVAFSCGAVIFFLAAIFSGFRLITQIKTDGIYVRYPPFQSQFVFFPWDAISNVYTRKYNALQEYNGWGIKFGIAGRSFTAGGDIGIQLELKEGGKVLIGTRLPVEVEQLLRMLGK